jgi:hypothetical protein
MLRSLESVWKKTRRGRVMFVIKQRWRLGFNPGPFECYARTIPTRPLGCPSAHGRWRRDCLGDMHVERKTLTLILNRVWGCGLAGFICHRIYVILGSCKHGNYPLDPLKGMEFFGKRGNFRFSGTLPHWQGNGPIRHVETCPDFFFPLQEYTQQNTLSKF